MDRPEPGAESGDDGPTGGTVRSVLVTAGACLVAGIGLGVLWWVLAPGVPMVVVAGGAVPEEYQPGGYVADDGVFTVLGLAAGLATAWVLLARGRATLPALVAGVVGGLVGSAAMWLVGTRLGRVDVGTVVSGSAEGDVFDAPLVLRMPGALLAWSIAATALVTSSAMVDWWLDRRARRRVGDPDVIEAG